MIENSAFQMYVVFFVTAVIFSILINSLFLTFSKTLGIRNDKETLIRWGSSSKPSLGGISFYIIFLLSIACYSILFRQPESVIDKPLLGFLGAATMAFLLGLADDAYNTKPFLKLGVQILCGTILIVTDTYIHLFGIQWLDYFITILWVIGIMNSINMLDNMDAVASIVSFFIIIAALIIQYYQQNFNSVYVLVLIGVAASLVGFLFFNWHPSKIYMGDTGSQFLGVVLASAGIVCFWNSPDAFGNNVSSKQVLVTALAFIVPIVDTSSVVINRISRGRSPFIGGRDHTTHSLFYMGVTEKKIAILFAFICLVSMTFIFIINSIEAWSYFHITLFSAYLLSVFFVLFYITRKKNKP